jgi:predicted metal-dependent hydrolase
VSKKNERIARAVEAFSDSADAAHYLAYFDLFNRGLFYEAHEVLEKIWLPQRKDDNGDFYKGLIQLAGAFVHLQKDRLRPAAALFKLAQSNLNKYGQIYEGLRLGPIRLLITQHLEAISSSNYEQNPLQTFGSPQILMTKEQ